MKTLITVATVEEYVKKQSKIINLPENSIITPAAKDAANKHGISFSYSDSDDAVVPAMQGGEPELIAQIVGEVLAALGVSANGTMPNVKEVDPSGITLVRGNKVMSTKLATAQPPTDKVKYAELVKTDAFMAGLLTIEVASFTRRAIGQETIYIVEGSLELTIDQRIYQAKTGDVYYIPPDKTYKLASDEVSKCYITTTK